MADELGKLNWYRSLDRALIPIEGIHVSKSLRKCIRQKRFEITFDTAFSQVVQGCARDGETWISDEIGQVFLEIHLLGWAHSCEVWSDGILAGGIYGLAIGGVFCAESMFHRKTNASKVALWALVNNCRELGFTMFDAQIMNPHLASLGAVSVSDEEYAKRFLLESMKLTEWSISPWKPCESSI